MTRPLTDEQRRESFWYGEFKTYASELMRIGCGDIDQALDVYKNALNRRGERLIYKYPGVKRGAMRSLELVKADLRSGRIAVQGGESGGREVSA